jgi:hypothetical protein
MITHKIVHNESSILSKTTSNYYSKKSKIKTFSTDSHWGIRQQRDFLDKVARDLQIQTPEQWKSVSILDAL